MTTDSNTISTLGTLAQLRAFAQESISNLEGLRAVACQQADLLRDSLATPTHKIPERLSVLIPSIRIEYVADLPLAGISFWTRKQWHIHVRANDSTRLQVTAILQELKRIIDWPLRTRTKSITNQDWNALAMQFAAGVLNVTTKPASPGYPHREAV